MSLWEFVTSLELGLIYGIATLGIFLSLRIIDFADLTCDGTFVLGAAVSAVLLQAGMHPLIALMCAAFAGASAGLLTGILHLYFKMSMLLAGILVAYMLYSINLKIMHGVPNIVLVNTATLLESNPLLVLLLISIVLIGLLSLCLASDFGLALRSIGQNKRLALNCGVKITSFTLFGLALSNALIAISGSLFSQHQSFADVSQGLGTVIIGFASLMIGEKLLPYRSIWIRLSACILGSIIYRLLIAVALHSEWLGLDTQNLNLITGLLVLAVMCLPPLRVNKKIC